jgi:competence protein ComEC
MHAAGGGLRVVTLVEAGASITAGAAARPRSGARWLGEQFALQRHRLALWTPVALGAGAGAYFALPREPLAWAAALAFTLAAGGLVLARRVASHGALSAALILAAFGMAGLGLAKVRTERVSAPIITPLDGPVEMEAWVVDVASPGVGGPRLLLAPIRIEGLAPEFAPIRARVTLRPGVEIPRPGEAIRVLALLNPPPPPASPGAYDFARDAFFESVGAVGLALRPPQSVSPAEAAPWRLRWNMKVNSVRWALARQIVADLGVRTGGLAAAMTTGHEAFIPPEQVDDLRAAGLAHIISISGLHMAIVGGFAFAAARLGVAAWPWLALRASGKKIAAAAGLAAVVGYLVLSGAPAPAQRAAITAAAAFGAILADRQAISLHSLAIAALAILVLHPEAVIEPGFQMSFSATAALVALAELWRRPVREINTPWPIRLIQGTSAWLAVSIAASFVAGLATGPFAIQHFNGVAVWGLPANLAAAPVSSFIMMPALAVGAALTPLGLGQAPLGAAGFGVELLLQIAHAAATAPHATSIVASAPAWALPAAFLGILWLCLWRGALRWFGLPLAFAVTLAPRPPTPELWVAADGAAAAVHMGDDALLFRPDVKLFAAELWARRRGLEPIKDEAVRNRQFDCDRWSCAPKPGGPPVAFVWSRRAIDPARFEALCRRAEIVVLRGDTPSGACSGKTVFDSEDFRMRGALELRKVPGGWSATWAQDLRGRRPWSWWYGL